MPSRKGGRSAWGINQEMLWMGVGLNGLQEVRGSNSPAQPINKRGFGFAVIVMVETIQITPKRGGL